jgi:P pilus assembly chaperone PapD
MTPRFALQVLLMAAGILVPTTGARAGLVLSQLVVELSPGNLERSDVEIWNNGGERAYVATEPSEIVRPGTSSEARREDPDPERLGLLVAPSQMILEPGERRLLRIATIASAARQERVYRVTVKPVVGKLATADSGLKVLIGYDVLVLVRPQDMKPHVSSTRTENQLILDNDGNVSVELLDGQECENDDRTCSDLPGGRLYAGARKTITVGTGRLVKYQLRLGTKLIPVRF